MTTLRTTPVARRVIGLAIAVHRELGPGLLENVYETCLAHELLNGGFDVARQVPVPAVYQGQRLDCAFRADLIVDGSLLVEVKSIDKLAPIHTAQGLTYLKLSGLKEGLLINFNERLLKDGIRSLLL